MDKIEFYELMDTDRALDAASLSQLRILTDKYPYFQAGLFLYLKNLYLLDAEDFQTELQRLSAFVSDRRALFYYVLSEEYERYHEVTGKSEMSEDRTSVLLDAFFDTAKPNDEEPKLERAILNSSLATTDYFSYLQSLEELPAEAESTEPEMIKEKPDEEGSEKQQKRQNIIDSFINKAAEEGGNVKIVLERPTDDSDRETPLPFVDKEEDLTDDIFFTETLATIYIKQRRYQKAYEIIKRLSLNFPEKNIYFADQLAFLEKLIINEKNKKR
ncbi:tetratricopeptide (TPR) repeat protein [Dysgonomonas sp. PH5-45]|uniref:hypothetical protein n=1 Tax=unclassified Dysgonomonas TaxID=2630389 RepID=UPI002473790B|nr:MULTISPECIES: hypothetical protein [unclassified Dysgonomonas]MDH6354426.1 tetratricopeptide (TPR) repeat protein [Dysgonomonas sp. PH5-45]MDH6387325.1 tetratricopeptide (TPR) repeat protein [Dysgonomonas sp. PH5-37]